MAETEVESILREIRERVLTQQGAGQDVTTGSAITNAGNGAGDSFAPAEMAGETANENLSLINSYLTTTGRAWDRLPPLVSNRSGFIARVELWLKRNLKRATRWYAWEQVNFNAAVHHALREMLPVLSAHEHELRRLSAQIAEARRIELEQYQAELNAQLTELNARLRTESNAQHRTTETYKAQVDARFAELHERDERLLDEQRVCFKQLALETSEAAVLEDRARRKTVALMEELQRRVSELEKGKK